jgi:hypothetical protein
MSSLILEIYSESTIVLVLYRIKVLVKGVLCYNCMAHS